MSKIQDNDKPSIVEYNVTEDNKMNETKIMDVKKININQSELSYYIESDIYDVSARNNGTTFESLSALLSSENLSTLIPTAVRCGGMSIRFIQSSDNKYVQYRLMANTFSTTVTDWQGVDDEPTAGSYNLVKSGGVANNFLDRDNTINSLKSSPSIKNIANTKIEQGFYICDSNGNIAAKINLNGIDAFKLSSHFYSLLQPRLTSTLSDGFYICDSNGNIAAKIDKEGFGVISDTNVYKEFEFKFIKKIFTNTQAGDTTIYCPSIIKKPNIVRH